MMPTISNASRLPEFHDDLLIVQFRPAAPLSAMGAAPTGLSFSAAPGLSALSFYERAGMIREVVPLGLKKPRILSPGMGPLAAASPGPGEEATALSGLNVIRLEKGTDHQQLRMALAQDPNVQAVSRVPVRYLLARRAAPAAPVVPPAGAMAVPPAASTMWNLQKIRWQQALAGGLPLARPVTVAVLDTGIDLFHPDLPGTDITYVHDYPNSAAGTSALDIVGHGTHVAGTIRALANNGVGINGICECKLSAYKIFDDQAVYYPSVGYFAYYVDPILYRAALAACIDAGVAVVNLSIGGYGEPDTAEKLLFQDLIANGTAVIAAMGNDNTSQSSYPAAIPGVIAVGATKPNDFRASFSNFGAHIALTAPGEGIWSTLPTYSGQSGFWPAGGSGTPSPGQPMTRETDYAAWDGTSMATPHVAAAAAMALEKYGSMTPAALRAKLIDAVDKVAGMNGQTFTTAYGAGRLNLMKL